MNWSQLNMTLVASIVKTFFARLPTPLMTFELHDVWIGAAQDIFINAADQLEFIKSVIDTLPNCNRETLRLVLKLFSSFYKGGSDENKKFIAPVWGPILLLRKSLHDFKTEVPDAAKLIHLLTKNYDAIFPEGQKWRPRSGQTPAWLKKINTDKFEKLGVYINKVTIVLDDVQKFGTESQVEGIQEFLLNLDLMQIKLKAIRDLVSTDTPLNYIVEMYHLDRFYNYISDFHDAFIQGIATNSLLRMFNSTRLRASFERLALACQYELVLFFQLVDEMYAGALRTLSSYQQTAREFFAQFLQDPQGQDLWSKRAGNDNFILAWPNFISSYQGYAGSVDASLELQLRRVLDNSDTGFVTIFRFAEFLKAFGPLKESIPKLRDITSQVWFHGYMTRTEAEKLLEVSEPGTFLVRFSSTDPGSCAINMKDPSGKQTRIKIDPQNGGYVVREGSGFRAFRSVSEIVTYYSAWLKIPFSDHLMDNPWFYGDLNPQETEMFLEFEPVGTFLVRFSSQPGCFTCSYMRTDGICHCRLQRLPNGSIEFDNRTHPSIVDFIQTNAKWLVIPFRNDNTVSSSQEEDENRRLMSLPFTSNDDEEDGSASIEYKDFFIGIPDVSQVNEEALNQLVQKSTTDPLSPLERRQMLEGLVNIGQDKAEKMQKKAHKEYPNLMARKKQSRKSSSLFGSKKSPIAFSDHFVSDREAQMCKLVTMTFTATSQTKGQVTFKVENPVEITHRYFLSVDPPNGTLEKGKQQQSFRVAVVLYKPISLRRLITITFNTDEGEEIYNIPLVVSVSKSSLRQEVVQDPYWRIGRSDWEELKRLGGGASASVFLANLYGALVAVKKWDIGKKDDPPRDFMAELDVFRSMRHENLVLFIGAMCETGTAFLVTEFLPHGSLDNLLQKHSVKTFGEKLNMSIDAAKGMRYVHSCNKIHRDMKSLNLLVENNLTTKVADFGESREKDANMTQATGTYNWMAPEVLMSQNYTMKADVFSFGIILWEILYEQYPNRSMQDVQRGAIPTVTDDVVKSYPGFVSIMYACCRLNPAKRPSFDTIVRQLKMCRRQLSGGGMQAVSVPMRQPAGYNNLGYTTGPTGSLQTN